VASNSWLWFRAADEDTSTARFRYHVRGATSFSQSASCAAVEKPIAIEEVQRELIQRIYRYLKQVRFVIAPLPLLVGALVICFDQTLWRRIAIGTVFPLAITLMVIEDRRERREGIPDLKRLALIVGAVLQPVGLIATGGVLSPVILAMLLIDFMASTLLEHRVSRILMVLQVAAIWCAALLEYSKLVGTLIPLPFRAFTGFVPSAVLLLVWVTIASVVFVGTHAMGCRIQSAFADLLHRVMRTRDDSLRLHQEQLSELTLLSGEIAHELKNPLASIKGLAALLSRRAQGDEPEPLTVLRCEVDRMQSILDSFLNFSRPLVPLNVSPADLCAIASDVCALHEGMSEEKGVNIELDVPAPVEVRCDPRKVRQILVNLFQNALDATAAHGHIVIRVHAGSEWGTVAIEDQGPGLDPELAPRVFEAGVTNKPGGSGLGLSVARGLARQHGGDITLTNGPSGGCVATLNLPFSPKPLDAQAEPLVREARPAHGQIVQATP
jgi:two-component system, NtrC family, sensor histidine kinase HydH